MSYKKPKYGKRVCLGCQRKFTPRRGDQLYCTYACRQRAYRKRKQADSTAPSELDLMFDPKYGSSSVEALFCPTYLP